MTIRNGKNTMSALRIVGIMIDENNAFRVNTQRHYIIKQINTL